MDSLFFLEVIFYKSRVKNMDYYRTLHSKRRKKMLEIVLILGVLVLIGVISFGTLINVIKWLCGVLLVIGLVNIISGIAGLLHKKVRI